MPMNFIQKHLKYTNKIQYITMEQGTVKFFNEAKGFGFIKSNTNGTEIFVHVSGLIDQIKQDDVVEFEATDGKKGLTATNVRLAH
jgi:CspA family cold shock protein